MNKPGSIEPRMIADWMVSAIIQYVGGNLAGGLVGLSMTVSVSLNERIISL